MLRDRFTTWYVRSSYLNNVKDGVGERLITLNSSILNTPAYRAAGWAQAADVKRTYSPPIPTTSSILGNAAIFNTQRVDSLEADEDDEGGMVTGRPSNDTIGPGPALRKRRRREQVDDDDSSDLSDESDNGNDRAAQQIRFAKMPNRTRADSSPIRESSSREGPQVVVTSPASKKSALRSRGNSMGAVEAVKARARADTATSSEMSSEPEVDPLTFERRKVAAAARHISHANFLQDRANEDARLERQDTNDDSDADSLGSGLSSEFGATADSTSLLGTAEQERLRTLSLNTPGISESLTRQSPSLSPKRTRTGNLLPDLPPPRPVSTIRPVTVSMLSQSIKQSRKEPDNPLLSFATLSGKGSPNPFWLKIYAPFSSQPDEPFEVALERQTKSGENVTIAEAIGLSLWRYSEENYTPALSPVQLNVNKWVLRLVEDGEVEYDFPALSRTQAVTAFAQNNTRGNRGRGRDKPFDEFALVEANAKELEANKAATPQYSPKPQSEAKPPQEIPHLKKVLIARPPLTRNLTTIRQHPALGGGPFASALKSSPMAPADQPAAQPSATPKLGSNKTIKIRYFDIEVSAQTMTMELSSDSYIAEVLDHVCKRWNLDKAAFLLKLAGTNTVAPSDRTLEALGNRTDLDLVRRRFGAAPISLSGSPGSTSPGAPLLMDIEGPRKPNKRGRMLHPLAHQQEVLSNLSNFKRYYVTRKQLKAFAQANNKVLVFDREYLHIMPADTGKNVFDSSNKTTSIPFTNVIKCKVSSKHHKLVRLVVQRPNEQKRYDLEAKSAPEAQEIVEEILKEVNLAKG